MRVGPIGVAASLFVLCCALPLPAQVGWRQVTTLTARMDAALAYDSARGRVVLFGGDGATRNGTFEWDGTAWQRIPTTVEPPPRTGHALAYDSARRRVVLSGGTATADTWEWDGTTWHDRSAAPQPPAGTAKLAYDAARSRTVMTVLTAARTMETWEWDGAVWTHRNVAGPPAIVTVNWSIAYAYWRRTTVFAAHDIGTQTCAFWEWDGSRWTALPATGWPFAYAFLSIVADDARQRIVMYAESITREWDGTAWQDRSALLGGPVRGCAAVFDAMRRRTLLFGGQLLGIHMPVVSQTWSWDGTNWSDLGPATPMQSYGANMVYHAARSQLVLHGGQYNGDRIRFSYADTWTFDGAHWRRLAGIVPPAGSSVLAYDSVRQRTVFFGIDDSPARRVSTWEWDGNAWASMPTFSQPVPTAQLRMADTGRGQVVLINGVEMWTWDGRQWLAWSGPAGPLPRQDAAVAYDEARGVVVLFGGRSGTANRDDTWEWDGQAWTERVVSPRPPAAGSICYDSLRRRLVMHTGAAPTTFWEWDGQRWWPRQPSPDLAPRTDMAFAFDRGRGVCVGFGGFLGTNGTDITSEYGPATPARAELYGAGCRGAAGVPALAPMDQSRPWLGDAFEFALAGITTTSRPALVLGTSRTQFGPLPLPLDLAPWAMPGCALLASADALILAANANGSVRIRADVPNDGGLLGRSLYLQGLATDPTANPAGIVWSNGLALTFGAK